MEAKKKWYQSGIAIGILIFLFFSVGMMSPGTPTKKASNNVQQKEGTTQSIRPSQRPLPSLSEVVNKHQAIVTKVVDGDTVTVSIEGESETIRIIGINSPETVDPRKSVECFGQKASSMAKEQLAGKKIQLESDTTQGERDKYGRLLRYIWLDDGISDFGALMIQNGYAYEYTYNTPYKYQAKYKQLQKDAEGAKKGLWADDACPQAQNNINSGASGTTASSGGDKDCQDFSSQAEAQAYFNSKGGSTSNNVDRLDGNDHDSIVCETLP